MKKVFTLFFKDNLWIVHCYLITFGLLAVLYYFLGGFNEGIFYFIFVACTLFCIMLIFHFFKTERLYRKIAKLPAQEENLLLEKTYSPIEEAFQEYAFQYQADRLQEIHQLKTTQKEQTLYLNQWTHQLKTPISVIRLICENHLGEDDFDKIFLENMRINEIVTQMMYLIRTEDFKQDFSIGQYQLLEIVKKATNSLKYFFVEKQIYPEVSISPDLLILTDKKWLELLIYQLLANAVKYTKKSPAKVMIYTEYNDNGELELVIKDEGIGIAKEDYRQLFDLFYTGSNGRQNGESTGMGLYIAKKISDGLGYHLTFDSTVGKGTVFKVQLSEEKSKADSFYKGNHHSGENTEHSNN